MWNDTITSKTVRHYIKLNRSLSLMTLQPTVWSTASANDIPWSLPGRCQTLRPTQLYWSAICTCTSPPSRGPVCTVQCEKHCPRSSSFTHRVHAPEVHTAPPKHTLKNINSNIINNSQNQKTTQMLHRTSWGIITKRSTAHQWEGALCNCSSQI